MMRVQYVGPNIGATGLYDGKVYEVSEIDPVSGALRIIDEDQSVWDYDNDPEWKPGYLYSATAPRPVAVSDQQPGKFYIVKDENGQLAAKGVLALDASKLEKILEDIACPLVGEWIPTKDCFDNQYAAKGYSGGRTILDSYRQIKDWKKVCRQCKWHEKW